MIPEVVGFVGRDLRIHLVVVLVALDRRIQLAVDLVDPMEVATLLGCLACSRPLPSA